MRVNRFSLLQLGVLSSFSVVGLNAGEKQQMNVIFFLADDLGWTDLGCYGSTFYETPNLDQLARDGMMFTNAYSACPVSSPTRVAFQTGRYPARLGITDFIRGKYHTEGGREEIQRFSPVLPPDNNFNMPAYEFTIAEALKEHGYRTAHIGKWHCAEDSLLWPEHQGYDINIAGCNKGNPGKGGYFSPYYNNPRLEDGPDGEYLTDRLGDECVKIIRQFKGQPFFINMPFYQVHTPLLGKPDKVKYFKEKAKRLGLDKLTEDEKFKFEPEWSKKQPFKDKRWAEPQLQSNAIYAAMISSMDENIGKIIGELKAQGLYENTIIIFTSDNGGVASGVHAPTCNKPLKAGKGHMYEGGIREPLIVHWPKAIKTGSKSETIVCTIDYYPTILQMLGFPLPQNVKLDGISIIPALKGEYQKREPVFWHYPHYANQGGRPAGAIRDGNYKLIWFFDDNSLELYDLLNDIGETSNLAEVEPQRVKTLYKKLQAWQKNVGAKMPTINPNVEK